MPGPPARARLNPPAGGVPVSAGVGATTGSDASTGFGADAGVVVGVGGASGGAETVADFTPERSPGRGAVSLTLALPVPSSGLGFCGSEGATGNGTTSTLQAGSSLASSTARVRASSTAICMIALCSWRRCTSPSRRSKRVRRQGALSRPCVPAAVRTYSSPPRRCTCRWMWISCGVHSWLLVVFSPFPISCPELVALVPLGPALG